jgi:hypothetical protein
LDPLISDTETSLADAPSPPISQRLGVTTREAGWLLSLGEARVRRLLRHGILVHAVARTLISGASLRAYLPNDELRPVREAALNALLDGRLSVPAPPTRYARPAPITEFTRYLTTNHDHPERAFLSCTPMIDPTLNERSNALTWVGYTTLERIPNGQSLQTPRTESLQ